MHNSHRYKLDPAVRAWVTSDLHFGHANVMKFCPKTRPFNSVHELNVAMIIEWNSKVGDNDVIFHLGDFTFTKDERVISGILAMLNGIHIFIGGNHDQGLRRMAAKGLVELYDYLEVLDGNDMIVMSHYLMRAWNRNHRGSTHMYGHCHGSIPDLGRSTDVGWDNQGGRICNLRSLNAKLKEREIVVLDGH
ncbi:phosphoesterase [Vibrio phage 234P6]